MVRTVVICSTLTEEIVCLSEECSLCCLDKIYTHIGVVNAFTPKTAFNHVSIQVQLNQELQVHTNTIEYYSQYQSRYGSVCILRYPSQRFNSIKNSMFRRILQPISIQIRFSLYSQISAHRYNSIKNSRFTRILQPISIQIRLSLYSKVSVLQIQLNLYPNLVLYIKRGIQDTSHLRTNKQLLTHCNQIGVLSQLNVF